GKRHPHPALVLTGPHQMGLDTSLPQRVNHPPGPVLIHPRNLPPLTHRGDVGFAAGSSRAKGISVTAIQELVDRNSFRAGTGPGPMASPPSLRVAVVACMDARLDPVQLLGLRPGEAHVIRNAGGVVTDDVIRSLAVSQRKLGT